MSKDNVQLWLQERIVYVPGACGGPRREVRVVSSVDPPAIEEGVTRTEAAPAGAEPQDWHEVKG